MVSALIRGFKGFLKSVGSGLIRDMGSQLRGAVG